MAHQNLFEALERITGFTALESDMFEIIQAVDKDRAKQNKPIDIEKKITAVEWLVNELEKHHIKVDIKNTVVFMQAKQMESQQIQNAFSKGELNYLSKQIVTPIEYYNETYNLTEPI